MSTEHNHPPRCCCASAGEVYVTGACPACFEHGGFACTCPPHMDGIGREKWPDCPVHDPSPPPTPNRRQPMADEKKPLRPLILHIEVDGFYADDLDEMAGYVREEGDVTPEDRLYVVTEEWMRPQVGITVVSWPGEKEAANDSQVHAYNGRIVGAEVGEPR